MEKVQISIKSEKNNGYLDEGVFTFMITSRLILLRTGNMLEKSCRENQRTPFILSNFFSENCAVYEILWEYMIKPDRLQMTL